MFETGPNIGAHDLGCVVLWAERYSSLSKRLKKKTQRRSKHGRGLGAGADWNGLGVGMVEKDVDFSVNVDVIKSEEKESM